MNQFKIYKSSAGSGKTYTLVKEYLCLVLRNPTEYKHILALTFTNKATEEMKTRVVEALIELSKEVISPQSSILSLRAALTEDCGLKTEDLRKNAQRALDNILHDYSNFSINTIDSFFNRIIRSLAKEIHLPMRLEIQIDADDAVAEVSSKLFDEITADKELSKWLTDFAFQKVRDDKGWNIEYDIQRIGKELLKEKTFEGEDHSRERIHQLLKELKAIKADFEKKMKGFGEKGLQLISEMGLSVEDFSRKSSGPAGYFFKITKRNADYSLNSYQTAGLASDEAWSAKASLVKEKITSLSATSLRPLLNRASEHYEKEFPKYTGAVEVLKRIFLLGIVEDMKKKFAAYRNENNLLLISDMPKLLGKVINEDEAPFVYEKSGNRYHHFLIDEFQDTSDLQWKNLLPLVINALGAGNFAMVVGDGKQSIYRWRGGNMNLLNSVKQDLAPFNSLIKEENLDTNFRSRKTIVDFNNEFFKSVPEVVNKALEFDEEHILYSAYSDELEQKTAEKNNKGGKVEIQIIQAGEDKKNAGCLKLLDTVHHTLERKYSYRDIAILVRSNTEGDEVASFLIANGITQVVSPDSLLLNRSPEVRFLISLFRYLNDHANHIAASEILFYHFNHNPSLVESHSINIHSVFSHAYSLRKAKSKKIEQPSLFEDVELRNNLFNKLLPKEFTGHLRSLSRLGVYELCEQLIEIFKLAENDAYVLRFLDLILEYSGKHDTSLDSFLHWWDESTTVKNASVITSENADAIRIMTIHKAKGLQFPVVIIPFADWSLKPKPDDVLWLEGEEKPFNEYGKLPVAAKNGLMNSVFKEGYEEETLLTVIDNINLLYVAFTRAEEELYVFVEENSSDNLNTVGKLITSVINRNTEWSTEFLKNKKMVLGEESLSAETKKIENNLIEVKDFAKLDWHSKIRLSLRSDELLEILDQPISKAINYGVLVHRILSSTKGLSDIEGEIDRIYFEGLINEEERIKLASEITALLNEKSISQFFTDEWTVVAEREITLPNGEILRPDRVLIKNDTATVIDFKTGKEYSAHKKQINEYAEALLKMDYKNVDRYLIYISERKVVKVTDKDEEKMSQTINGLNLANTQLFK